MIKHALILTLLCVAMLSCGCYNRKKVCVYNGKNFNQSTVNQIHIGTTPEAVIGVMGQPQQETVDTDGNLKLVYSFKKTTQRSRTIFGQTSEGQANMVHKELTILFVDGLVTKMDYDDNVAAE